MTIRFLVAVTVIGLAWVTSPARSDEGPDAHAKVPTKTIVLAGDTIQPANMNMAKGDVLEFENHALHPIRVHFTEPESQADKIRCRLLDPKASAKTKPPWALFSLDAKQQMVANIPPGRFASVCSIAPGHYAYVADLVGGANPRRAAQLGQQKGTIEVQ